MQFSEQQIQLEAALLKSFTNYDNYKLYYGVLNEKRLMPNTIQLFQDYKLYFKTYEKDIDWGTFYTHFTQEWHKNDMDEDDIKMYVEHILPYIQQQDHKDVEQCLGMLRSLLLSEDIEKEIKGKNRPNVIQDLLNQHKASEAKLQKLDEWELGTSDLGVLDTSKGIPWALPTLQAGLLSKMPGQFVVVAGDENMGKSAFCITDAIGVLKWLYKNNDPRCILYCTSEDTREDLDTRLLSNLYSNHIDGGFEEIINRRDEVNSKYLTTFGPGRFRSMQIRGPQDLPRIKQKIDTFKPCVVYIDMIDSLSKDLGNESLTLLYNTIRSWANEGVPIVGTTQAGNTQWTDRDGNVHKLKWLTSKHMAGSKFGKQGAATVSIMIGGDDSEQPGIRNINTTKKKRGNYVAFSCQLVDRFSMYKELM